MICDVCGLPDNYRGQGDGIGSCNCPRCDCGEACGSTFCTCYPNDGADDYDARPWPGEPDRPVETVAPPGAYL